MMKHVVKRNRTIEAFDIRKLYASMYAACLSAHESTATAELVAEEISTDITRWIANKSEVTANDIRKQAGLFLTEINPHAGYLYLHHRIMW